MQALQGGLVQVDVDVHQAIRMLGEAGNDPGELPLADRELLELGEVSGDELVARVREPAVSLCIAESRSESFSGGWPSNVSITSIGTSSPSRDLKEEAMK